MGGARGLHNNAVWVVRVFMEYGCFGKPEPTLRVPILRELKDRSFCAHLTWGVRLLQLELGDKVAAAVVIPDDEEPEEENGSSIQ